jgi:hypothetical protein
VSCSGCALKSKTDGTDDWKSYNPLPLILACVFEVLGVQVAPLIDSHSRRDHFKTTTIPKLRISANLASVSQKLVHRALQQGRYMVSKGFLNGCVVLSTYDPTSSIT